MKVINLAIIIVAIGLTACGKKTEAQSHDKDSMQASMQKMEGHENMNMKEHKAGMNENEKIMYYTCPMESHKHVNSDKPGNCPECGMKLVPVVKTSEENKEFYGCMMPSHSHIRSDKPGDCPECGMKLMPMRMDKGS